jgi:hypothetical protein
MRSRLHMRGQACQLQAAGGAAVRCRRGAPRGQRRACGRRLGRLVRPQRDRVQVRQVGHDLVARRSRALRVPAPRRVGTARRVQARLVGGDPLSRRARGPRAHTRDPEQYPVAGAKSACPQAWRVRRLPRCVHPLQVRLVERRHVLLQEARGAQFKSHVLNSALQSARGQSRFERRVLEAHATPFMVRSSGGAPGARTARRASARARAPAAPARHHPARHHQRRPRAPARAPPARAGRAAGACAAPARPWRRRTCACAPRSPPVRRARASLEHVGQGRCGRVCSLQGRSAATQPPTAESAPHETVFFNIIISSWPAAAAEQGES